MYCVAFINNELEVWFEFSEDVHGCFQNKAGYKNYIHLILFEQFASIGFQNCMEMYDLIQHDFLAYILFLFGVKML